MDCNTCHCGDQNNLLCTKAACLHPLDPETIENVQRVDKRSIKELEDKKKQAKKTVRQENISQKTDSSGDDDDALHQMRYPTLPPSRICFPGRIYQEGCQRCYCNSDRKLACSTENACKEPKDTQDLRPVDVRPEIRDKELMNLTVLPHFASPCTPGTTYKVDCNVCVCDEFRNLLCDKLLCVSYSDMHTAEARRKSGLTCNSDNFVENDLIQSKCVQCACNGTTYCHAKEGCVAEAEQMIRTHGSKRTRPNLALDSRAGICLPGYIYKYNCNKCFCTQEYLLQCTMKTCLNYSQALVMEKEQKHILDQGL